MITEEQALEKVKKFLHEKLDGIELVFWSKENKYGWIFDYQDVRATNLDFDDDRNYGLLDLKKLFVLKRNGEMFVLHESNIRDYEEEEFKDL